MIDGRTDPGHPLAADLDHVLDHARPAWEELRGARVFVTAGTGFIGTWLLESFAWANARLGLGARLVAVTENRAALAACAPHVASDSAVELVGDGARRFDPPPGGFTHVIHGAVASTEQINPGRPLRVLETIVDDTRRAMEVAESVGARRVLLLSSGAVYGRQPPAVTRVSEDYLGGPDPVDPSSAYAQGVRASELLTAVWARRGRLAPVIARCFDVVGPHLPLDDHVAIGNFIGDALARRPLRLTGDGSSQRSYLYAADLAAWLWTILVRGGSGRVYNVGSERAVSLREAAGIVHEVLRAQGAGAPVGVREPDRAVPPQRYVPSTQRARDELGLAESVGLEEAIRRTWAWHAHLRARTQALAGASPHSRVRR